jgi:hypothetical protein
MTRHTAVALQPPFWVTAAKDKDELTFTAFDPVRGGGRELARFKVDDPEKFYAWDLSPDSARIAVLKLGGSKIYMLSLRTMRTVRGSQATWNINPINVSSDPRSSLGHQLNA